MNKGIKISGKILPRYNEILSNDALEFIQEIHENFNNERLELLKERRKRQKAIDNGEKLDFLNETKKIRNENNIKNINHFRDFIHIDDVCESIINIMERKFESPINISSGKKINLVDVCKNINKLYFKKELSYEKKRGKDLFGNNKLLKSLGKNKFKNIIEIIKSYKK